MYTSNYYKEIILQNVEKSNDKRKKFSKSKKEVNKGSCEIDRTNCISLHCCGRHDYNFL